MNRQNSLDTPKAHLSRHSHNVSASYTASCSTGHIIPQWFDIAQPGDSYYINTYMWARLQDMVTAFLGEVDIHVDYFFVPMTMLYTPFGQVFAQTNDFVSSVFDRRNGQTPVIQSNQDRFPIFSIEKLIEQRSPTAFLDGHSDCWGRETARLLDALDMNPLGVCSQNMVNRL